MNFRQARTYQDANGTFGTLSIQGYGPFLVTLEPATPIPAGHYTVAYLNHPIHGWCWEIQNVPGHTGVLFHIGNTARDTADCTCLGESFGRMTGPDNLNVPCILSSKIAVAAFTAMLEGQVSFELDIVDCF